MYCRYYEPSQGAVLGTKEFMTGLGRGTMDFLGGITMGVTGLASAGLETAASAIEQLSFNKEYIEGRQAHRARAPKNALHGCVCHTMRRGHEVACRVGRCGGDVVCVSIVLVRACMSECRRDEVD